MRLLVFSCLFAIFVSESLGLGYHQDVGILEAERIRLKEVKKTSRIVGGMPSQYGDNPHLAGLLITLTTGQMSVCSGTLLSENKVLTAGQCWYDGYSQGRSVQVVLGSLELFSSMWRDVRAISVHPGFNPQELLDDLAILTLRSKVIFDEYIKPAILPTYRLDDDFEGVSARVSGYGKTSDWSPIGPDTKPSAVSVPITGIKNACLFTMPQRPRSFKLICTKGNNGWGTCGADLGGPMVVEDYYHNGSALLIGVTSIQSPFGCQTGFPTAYTRVSEYLDWIQRNL